MLIDWWAYVGYSLLYFRMFWWAIAALLLFLMSRYVIAGGLGYVERCALWNLSAVLAIRCLLFGCLIFTPYAMSGGARLHYQRAWFYLLWSYLDFIYMIECLRIEVMIWWLTMLSWWLLLEANWRLVWVGVSSVARHVLSRLIMIIAQVDLILFRQDVCLTSSMRTEICMHVFPDAWNPVGGFSLE